MAWLRYISSISSSAYVVLRLHKYGKFRFADLLVAFLIVYMFDTLGFVQYLQFRYQQGCLYRLKALGERHDMDITIEGFHSWMWRGLSFLLPFLYTGYFYQLYNAWALYQLISHPDSEWQVNTKKVWESISNLFHFLNCQIPVLSFLFLILFLGNTLTTSMVIPQKLKDKVRLKYRFTRLDKYFSTYTKEVKKIS